MTKPEYQAALKVLTGRGPQRRKPEAPSGETPKAGTATGTTSSGRAPRPDAPPDGFDARTASREDVEAAARALGITMKLF